ncbi:MAG TPA: aspartate/glutamate racemase family protein [Burkholderiaceae bacterium]|nr:aspartate/glutamate racemase family protein [Burkholderiaceae bacterium]
MSTSLRPLPIGIVACSAEGAALCYRTVCAEAAQQMGPHAHPELAMHSHSLADYVHCIDRNDWAGVAELMLDSARKLAAIGAELLICPDNTIHQAMPLVLPRAPRPWLHIAEVVAAEAASRGLHRIGLTGTRWLVDGPVYPTTCIRPSNAERDEVHRIIMDELVNGVFAPASVAALLRVIDGLRERGCDAVVLGCTELPLVIGDANSSLPTLDSTRLLARAALRASVSGAVR